MLALVLSAAKGGRALRTVDSQIQWIARETISDSGREHRSMRTSGHFLNVLFSKIRVYYGNTMLRTETVTL
jgi:hypothetical protein